MKTILILIVGILIFSGVSTMAKEATQKPKVEKVSVMKNGKILLNGNEIKTDQLRKQLENTKKESGSVWYYREQANSEPPPQAMEVMKIIADLELPISMSTKPDFSDYVDDKGRSFPRTK